MHDADGLDELLGAGSLVDVALGPRRQRLQDGLVVGPGAGHDDAQVGTHRLQAGHHVEQVLGGAAAQQRQVHVLVAGDLGHRRGHQLEFRVGIEQGAEAHKTQGVALDHGDADARFLHGCRFHAVLPARVRPSIRHSASPGKYDPRPWPRVRAAF